MADSHLLGAEHLHYDDIDGDDIDGDDPRSKHSSSWLPRQARNTSFFLKWLPWIIHLLLFSISGSLLLVLASRYRESAKSHGLPTGLFYEGNEFRTVVKRIGERTDFEGRPSSVNENYWNGLLYSMYYSKAPSPLENKVLVRLLNSLSRNDQHLS